MRRPVLAVIALFAALLSLGGVAAAGGKGGGKGKGTQNGTPTLEVVADGLDNPRGLAVGRWGEIYVAEAGRGGTAPCVAGPDGDLQCAGETGAITRIWHGKQRRILTGLPSLAAQADGGRGATGPHDVALRRHGGAYFTVGLGANPAERVRLGSIGPKFGHLYKVSEHGHVRSVADLAGFEADENPDGGEPDSNPFKLTTDGGRPVVADAGGNDVLKVRRKGGIKVLATFADRLVPPPDAPPNAPPTFPMQSVPTAPALGPDGAYYVSELTGFPFVVGAARVHRLKRGGGSKVFATGFTNLVDLAFDRHGNLYVLEIATNGILSGDETGALHRIAPDGSKKLVVNVQDPTGLAIDRKGGIYISAKGTYVGEGQVVRLKFGRH